MATHAFCKPIRNTHSNSRLCTWMLPFVSVPSTTTANDADSATAGPPLEPYGVKRELYACNVCPSTDEFVFRPLVAKSGLKRHHCHAQRVGPHRAAIHVGFSQDDGSSVFYSCDHHCVRRRRGGLQREHTTRCRHWRQHNDAISTVRKWNDASPHNLPLAVL